MCQVPGFSTDPSRYNGALIHVIGTPYYQDNSDTIVSDLTVDGNYQAFGTHIFDWKENIGAVSLNGSRCTIRNVKGVNLFGWSVDSHVWLLLGDGRPAVEYSAGIWGRAFRNPGEIGQVGAESVGPGAPEDVVTNRVRDNPAAVIGQCAPNGAAARCGAPGEIFGLTWERLTAIYADIRQRAYRGMVDSPKTDRSFGKAALSERLLAEVESWQLKSVTVEAP